MNVFQTCLRLRNSHNFMKSTILSLSRRSISGILDGKQYLIKNIFSIYYYFGPKQQMKRSISNDFRTLH